MGQIKIRKSVADDINTLMEMFENSRHIMRQSGNSRQWVGGYPSISLVEKDIQRGISHIIMEDGVPIGTFVFIIGRDPTYEEIEGGVWYDDMQPYGTIHRIAKTSAAHGIFEACIEWCKCQATSLRINTHEDNSIMMKLIEQQGFCYRGIIYVNDGTPRKAYQMTPTGTLCEPLRQYTEQNILPKYDQFDSAHRRDHAETVIEKSLELAKNNNADINMAYTVAAYHDIGLCEGRERHHIVSGQMMMEDTTLNRWFSPSQLQLMRDAIEDHRASSGNAPRSIYGMIVAEADRDIEPLKIIRRTIQYGLSNYPELDKEDQWRRALEHLHEKYAEGGYLRLWLPQGKNAENLEKLREIIRNKTELRKIFDRIHHEEMTKIEMQKRGNSLS